MERHNHDDGYVDFGGDRRFGYRSMDCTRGSGRVSSVWSRNVPWVWGGIRRAVCGQYWWYSARSCDYRESPSTAGPFAGVTLDPTSYISRYINV